MRQRSQGVPQPFPHSLSWDPLPRPAPGLCFSQSSFCYWWTCGSHSSCLSHSLQIKFQTNFDFSNPIPACLDSFLYFCWVTPSCFCLCMLSFPLFSRDPCSSELASCRLCLLSWMCGWTRKSLEDKGQILWSNRWDAGQIWCCRQVMCEDTFHPPREWCLIHFWQCFLMCA